MATNNSLSGNNDNNTSRRSVVGVLDLGSDSVTCVIAEAGQRHSGAEQHQVMKVLGHGRTASRGIRAGAVTDVHEAEYAIRLAVDAAEQNAQRRLREVYVGVAGGRARSEFCHGIVATQTGVVSPRDVENAISSAVANLQVGRRHALHLMPCSFALDGTPSDTAPLGLHGEELAVELSLVTVDQAALRNVEAAVERAHLGISGYSLAPYAAGRGALSPDEKALGALVIDFGGQVTSFAMFRNGKMAFAGTLPLGGKHVTQDIAQGLSTTIAHAERMKTLFGSVLPTGHDDREYLSVPLAGEQGTDTVQKVPKHVLTSIVRPRVEETLYLVRGAVEPNLRFLAPTTKLVLTGGGSQLHGLKDLASEVFGLQARIGSPRIIQGLPDHLRNASACVAAGLTVAAVYPDKQYAMPRQAQAAIDRANTSYVRRVGRWLADSL